MVNYQKSLKIAQKLGLYQSNVQLLSDVVRTLAPTQDSFLGRLTGITQKTVFDTGVSVGRAMTTRVFPKQGAARYID